MVWSVARERVLPRNRVRRCPSDPNPPCVCSRDAQGSTASFRLVDSPPRVWNLPGLASRHQRPRYGRLEVYRGSPDSKRSTLVPCQEGREDPLVNQEGNVSEQKWFRQRLIVSLGRRRERITPEMGSSITRPPEEPRGPSKRCCHKSAHTSVLTAAQKRPSAPYRGYHG